MNGENQSSLTPLVVTPLVGGDQWSLTLLVSHISVVKSCSGRCR